MDEDVEGLRNTRGRHIVALDDGLVGLGTAGDVVGLDGEDFLKDVRGAEGFECPDLHLTETLTAEVGLTAEGLLSDEGIGADGTGMHLVVDHVVEFEHIDVADGGGLVETLAGLAVVEVGAAVFREASLTHIAVDLFEGGAIEDRRLETFAQLVASPTEDGFIDLTEVHTGRHAEGVEDDVNRRAVGEERHILGTDDLGDDTLVAVAASHLVADAEFALHGEIDLGHLDDARREVVADGEGKLVAGEAAGDFAGLDVVVVEEFLDEVVGFLVGSPLVGADLVVVDRLEGLGSELDLFGDDFLFMVIIDAVGDLAGEQDEEAVNELVFQLVHFEIIFSFRSSEELFFLGTGLAVADDAREEFLVDDDATDRRWDLEGGILDIAGLVAKDGAEKFFLGSGVGLTLRRDLADEDVALPDLGADTDDAVFVEILGGVVADVGDVASEFLDAAFGLADFEGELFDVDRGEDVLTHHAFGDDDSILEVVALPRHESDFEVAAESEFAALSGEAFAKHLTLLDLVALLDDGTEVDGGGVVGALIFGETVFLDVVVERDETFLLGAVVTDDDLGGIDIFDHAVALGVEEDTRVFGDSLFDAGTDDRDFGVEQRDSLTHHVGTHEGTVGVVVFEERNEGSGDGSDLVGSDVDEVNLFGSDDGEVGLTTGLDLGVEDVTLVVLSGSGLSDGLVFFGLGREVDRILVDKDLTIDDTLVGSFDEAQLIDLSIDAKRRDEADVWAFRSLDGAETAVVGVVDVADLETGTFAGEAAGAESGDTTFVGDFGQRVGLVHELAELVGAEERVDDRREGLGIDELGWGEHLVVADVHAFADGARHAGETYAELVVELFAHGADAAVGEVVDIIDISLLVDELDEVFDDRGDVLLGEDADIVGDGEVEFCVDAVTSHIAEVVTLVGEEEFLDDAAGSFLVRRFSVAELAIDIFHSLLGIVGCVLFQSVVDDRIVEAILFFDLNQDRLDVEFLDFGEMIFGEFDIAFDDDLGTFHGDDFASVFIDEVFDPTIDDTSREALADEFFNIRFADFDFFGKVENVEDVFVGFVSDGAEQGSDGEFLFSVDVSIHDIVDIGSKLHPRATEGDDTSGIELCTIGVELGAEENARRAVQLRDYDTFSAIDDKSALGGHVRDHAQVHRLFDDFELFVVGVGTIEFEFSFEGDAIGEATFDTLLDGVARRVDIVVQKL